MAAGAAIRLLFESSVISYGSKTKNFDGYQAISFESSVISITFISVAERSLFGFVFLYLTAAL